jgi:hypothetical protein
VVGEDDSQVSLAFIRLSHDLVKIATVAKRLNTCGRLATYRKSLLELGFSEQ